MKRTLLITTLFLLFQTALVSAEIPRSSDASALLAEGDRLYETRDEPGHADQAIETYQKIVRIDPKNEEALWRLSRSFKWRGDTAATSEEKLAAYKEGEAWAKQALQVNPDSIGGHLMLGIAYGRIGETQGVLKSLSLISPIKNEMDAVLTKDPHNPVAHHVLGVLYRKVPGLMGGSIRKSIEELEEAVQVNPTSTTHRLDLAKSYLEKGNKENAKTSLEALLSISHPSDRVQAQRDRAEAEKLLSEIQPR
ncbi:MAG: tetratricopeptide repeat protein [Candidatus Manganitrophaceae bacterium]